MLSSSRSRQTLLFASLTAVCIGYLLVWLPGPAAGLQFMGLEMGEWTKFLGLDTRRNYFYLPPVTLSLILLLLSATWSNKRWQTWLWRVTAVAVSLLAFPAWEDLNGLFQAEYMARVQWIGAVLLVVVLTSIVAHWRERPWLKPVIWVCIIVLAAIAVILPTSLYLDVQPVVAQLLGQSVGIGIGVWLNGIGNILVILWATLALWRWLPENRKRST